MNLREHLFPPGQLTLISSSRLSCVHLPGYIPEPSRPSRKIEKRKSKREKLMRKKLALFTLIASSPALAIICVVSSLRAATPAPGASGYHLVKTVPVPGDEGWDYILVDSDARRVYISHGSHVVVMN